MKVYSNSEQKPQTLSIRHLPDEDFQLLNQYMGAFLSGDLDAAQKALERLDSPRLPNEKVKPGNLLIMGEPENDNLKKN
jgi:hypothetical protein